MAPFIYVRPCRTDILSAVVRMAPFFTYAPVVRCYVAAQWRESFTFLVSVPLFHVRHCFTLLCPRAAARVAHEWGGWVSNLIMPRYRREFSN